MLFKSFWRISCLLDKRYLDGGRRSPRLLRLARFFTTHCDSARAGWCEKWSGNTTKVSCNTFNISLAPPPWEQFVQPALLRTRSVACSNGGISVVKEDNSLTIGMHVILLQYFVKYHLNFSWKRKCSACAGLLQFAHSIQLRHLVGDAAYNTCSHLRCIANNVY